jgi:hypothetical protein
VCVGLFTPIEIEDDAACAARVTAGGRHGALHTWHSPSMTDHVTDSVSRSHPWQADCRSHRRAEHC